MKLMTSTWGLSLLLAETRAEAIRDVLFYVFVLSALTFGIVLIGIWIKKRVTEDEDSAGPGFSLSELKRMHAAGELSDEQYQRARNRLIGAFGGQTQAEAADTDSDEDRPAEEPDNDPSPPPDAEDESPPR